MLQSFKIDGLKHIGPPAPEQRQTATRIGLDHDPRLARRATSRRCQRLTRESNAVSHIGTLPGPGEDLVLILTGNFHGWDVLAAILQLADTTADELIVATLGFNNAQADHLAEMLDSGTVKRCTFVVSEMFSQKNAAEFDHLADVLTSRGHRIAANRNHCKLMLVRLADGRHIVTHGSLNLRRCNAYEQMVISHDQELYDFFKQFITEIVQ